MSIRIKNWSKHQHFKDRTPPWIKLYRDILDDPDWHELDGDSSKMLVSLWLIASEDETHQGVLPDMRRLAFRLRITESQLKQRLTKLSHWLIHDDIDVISEGHQGDAPETEGETEKSRSAEPKSSAVIRPADVDEQVWKDWIALRKSKRATVTQTVIDGAKEESEKAGMTLNGFLKVWCTRGSQGLQADWLKPNERMSGQQTDSKSMFAGML